MGSKSSRLRNNHNQNQGTPSSTTSRSTVNSAFTLNGLYSECSWDSKAIKALIVNKRLAPLHRGSEQEIRITKPIIATKYNEECPICFLFYTGGLNRTVCCKKCICTECFLQIKPPTKKVPCPFCNSDVLFVIFKGPLSVEEIEKEEMERKILEDHAERVLEEQRNSSTRRNTLSKEDLVVAIDVEAFGGKTDATETEQVAADHDTNPDQQGNDAVALDTADADADAFCSSSSSLRSSSSSSSSSSASSSSSLAASDDESDNAAQRVKNSGRRHKNKHKDKPVPAAAFVAAAAPNSNNDEPVVNAANDGQVAFDVLSSVGVGSHPNSLPPGMTVESLENLMIEQAIRLSLQQANDKKDVTASSSSSINTNQPQHQQHQQPEELHQQAHQASADAHLSPLASTEHDNDDDNNHAAIIVVNDDADDDATPTLMQVPATATTTVMSSSSSSSTVVPKKTSRASSLSRRSSRGGAARDSADFSSISDSQSGIDPSPLTVPTMSSSTTSCNDDDDDPREESVLASPDTSSKLSIVHFDTAVAADGDKPRSKTHRRRKSSLAAKVSSSSAPGQVSATAAATAAATSASSSSSSSSSRRRSSKSALSRSAQGKMY